MTLEALSDETGMSKTRMSQVVREMLSLNVAHKVFEKGVRKDLYDVEKDYYQTFISIFVANWQAVIAKTEQLEKEFKMRLNGLWRQKQTTCPLTKWSN